MKLIQQSVEEIYQEGFDLVSIKKHIEKCARISYKSEGNITESSYEKFVDNLTNHNHSRPLEFGTIHLKMDPFAYDNLINKLINKGMFNQLWLKAYESSISHKVYITTNYRYYLDILKYFPIYELYVTPEDDGLFPKRHTIKFVTNRAIMDEIRTHIGLSHLAESTRWCNYSKDKFNNELTFIIPPYVNTKVDTDSNSIKWSDTVYNCEQSYLKLLQDGWKPQEARDVLPLSIKSELVSCGFEDVWSNFIYRRSDKAAHPMVKELSDSIKNLEWMKKYKQKEN